MNPVTIIRHIECEGPGYLEKVLNRSNIEFQLIAIDQHQPLPTSPEDMSGLIIMGGPMSVNDKDDWIAQETKLIQQAIDNNVPVLGHCLGGQFIAKALGARIIQNPVKEIGWLPVYTEGSQANLPEWTNEFSSPQTVFHWHGETFELPDGATRLLSSQHCDNQAFIYKDNVLAFQCHIEMTATMVDEWSALYEDELQDPSETLQTRTQMLAGCEQHISSLNKLADKVYEYWLQQLDQT